MRWILAVLVVAFVLALGACSAQKPPLVITSPATLHAGCDVPDDQRVLRARLELERGEGAITVDGQTGGPCAIFALTPGLHRVAIHAAGPSAFGIAAVLQAFSNGTAYDVFDLHCGFPGSCDTDTLRSWQTDVQTARTRMTDPCAALKVTAVRWDSEKLDDLHPKSLDVSFELHVYSKPSGKPPHDPSCPER